MLEFGMDGLRKDVNPGWMRLASLLLLVFLVSLNPSLSRGEGPVVGAPQMTFQLDRRQFYFPSADLATTNPLRLEATVESLRERGFTHGHYDELVELSYIQRRSVVDVRITPDGDMLYLERMPDDAQWDYSEFLHQLSLPIGPRPNETINPLMALHPFTMFAPEFEIVRELHEPDILSRDVEEGIETIHTPDWVYRILTDPETGELQGIEQYVADLGWLFRETSFENWKEAPSGRVLPTRVHTRTFYEGMWPYAELIFTDITENAVPEFKGNPAQIPAPEF